MSDVHLEYVNEAYIRVRAERSIIMELGETLTYYKENYKFDPKYKSRMWDGKIRLLNGLTCILYAGLAQRVQKFCKDNDYTFSFDDELVYHNVSVNEVNEHLDSLNLPDWLDRRDYQVEAIVKCLRSRRRTLISPTSSGKSFMIYAITMWYKQKTLIIVPRTGLVHQFKSDLESYGFQGVIHTSAEGLLKDNDIPADIVITTWQSLDNGKKKMPKEWFNQFKVVFGDEAHGCKATTLIKILTNMEHTPYRFGTTGTLDKNNLNKATIEGLFGPVYTSTTTRELIDEGHAADIKIKCIVLKYPEEVRKEFNKGVKIPGTNKRKYKTYQEEIDFIINYEPRNAFIKNLALSLKGNKLVFFRRKEHGETIYGMLAESGHVYYIDGDVKDREDIRQAMEKHEEATLVASLGTTSTGVSIKRLHHMIATHPSKAEITLRQAIGRMLRQHDQKEVAYMYDIVDDISYGARKNYALTHFEARSDIYDQEQFDYKIYTVKIK